MNEQDDIFRENIQKNSLVPFERGEVLAKHEIVSRSVVKNMIREAMEAKQKGYYPYSKFGVGAAILTTNGKIYSGCNIENASYGATNCAERTALFKAVSEGERKFSAIVIIGGKGGVVTDYLAPCGICRQVLREFVNPVSFLVILAKSEEDYIVYSLEALLPLSFGPDNLL